MIRSDDISNRYDETVAWDRFHAADHRITALHPEAVAVAVGQPVGLEGPLVELEGRLVENHQIRPAMALPVHSEELAAHPQDLEGHPDHLGPLQGHPDRPGDRPAEGRDSLAVLAESQ